MSKVQCPKCREEGECEHEPGGQIHNGIFYDEYSFKCSKCGYVASEKFPIDHAQNKCSFCGKPCNLSAEPCLLQSDTEDSETEGFTESEPECHFHPGEPPCDNR